MAHYTLIKLIKSAENFLIMKDSIMNKKCTNKKGENMQFGKKTKWLKNDSVNQGGFTWKLPWCSE